jgi:hypothetical protein
MCACVSIDAYNCWAQRYGMMRGGGLVCSEIDDGGGPCECDCHVADNDEFEND